MAAAGVMNISPSRPVASVWLVRAIGLGALLLAWEALSRSGLLYSGITPSVGDVVAAGWKLVTQSGFYRHLGVTAAEILAAFVIGSLLGVDQDLRYVTHARERGNRDREERRHDSERDLRAHPGADHAADVRRRDGL
jgi:hypothetical protein